MMNFAIIKDKASPFMIKLILALCIIQVTTIVHEMGHALPILYSTDSHVTLTLGSTSQKSEVLFSIGERFDIEIAGLMPGVGIARWNGNDPLSILEKIVVCAGGPITNLAIFYVLFFYTKRVAKAKQPFIVTFTMMYSLYGFLVTIAPIIYPVAWGGYGGQQSDGYQLLMLLLSLI